jgi:hypothetical protein
MYEASGSWRSCGGERTVIGEMRGRLMAIMIFSLFLFSSLIFFSLYFLKLHVFFPILYFLLLIIPSHSKTFHTLSFSFFLIIFIFILVLFLSLSCSEKGLEMFKLVLHYFLNYYCAH